MEIFQGIAVESVTKRIWTKGSGKGNSSQYLKTDVKIGGCICNASCGFFHKLLKSGMERNHVTGWQVVGFEDDSKKGQK